MKLSNVRIHAKWWCGLLLLAALLPITSPASAAPHRIAVLMLGDVRLSPFNGFKKGLTELGFKEGPGVVFEVHDAGGERSNLAGLAKNIVEGRPAVAIACGGVEADALKKAAEGTGTPVVFLAVASAVERGLVASMRSPGGNLTGIDTNDTALTAKRLWLIKSMFPGVKRVLIPVIPTITPSVEAVKVAREAAPELGLEIEAVEAADKEGMHRALLDLQTSAADAIYIGTAAPVWQIEKDIFFEMSETRRIPIMGNTRDELSKGAVATYGCSRFDTGVQAARLVKKILAGELPRDIPAETPDKLEFVINKLTVERLGLDPPNRVWRLADEIVSIDVR